MVIKIHLYYLRKYCARVKWIIDYGEDGFNNKMNLNIKTIINHSGVEHEGDDVNDICFDGRSDPKWVKNDICFWHDVAKDGDGNACVEVARIAFLSTCAWSPSRQTLQKCVKILEFEGWFRRHVGGHWGMHSHIGYGENLDIPHCMVRM